MAIDIHVLPRPLPRVDLYFDGTRVTRSFAAFGSSYAPDRSELSTRAWSRPWPIRSKVCFSTAVLACTHEAGHTKEMVQIQETPFPCSRVGSGDETMIIWPLYWQRSFDRVVRSQLANHMRQHVCMGVLISLLYPSYLATKVSQSLASSPGHSQFFNVAHRKEGGHGI
jgi:hypothetical protein